MDVEPSKHNDSHAENRDNEMPRPRNAIPTEQINLTLPQDVKGRLDLHLVSESTAKIPQGAYQRFFLERIYEFFEWGSLDLAAYVVGLPAGSVLRGPKALIKMLEAHVLSRTNV